MGRKKKITVKPFANTELASNPRQVGKVEEYPLYVRVTYDRTSTKFPVEGGNYWVTSEQIEHNLYPGKDAVKRVEEIAELERKSLENLGVSAFPSRYKVYTYAFVEALDRCLIRSTMLLMEDVLTVSKFKEWKNQTLANFFGSLDKLYPEMPEDIQTLIDAAKLIKSTQAKIRLYEWVLGYPSREILVRALRDQPGNLLEQIKILDMSSTILIDRAVTS